MISPFDELVLPCYHAGLEKLPIEGKLFELWQGDRVAWHRSGYSVVEVDIVATRISRYFAAGEPITADQVRSAAFHPQRGGYREEQVDAALDAAVRVILAVR